MKIKTIAVREQEAFEAFEVHRALVATERAAPNLRRNPRWQLIRMDAFEAFNNAFEVL